MLPHVCKLLYGGATRHIRWLRQTIPPLRVALSCARGAGADFADETPEPVRSALAWRRPFRRAGRRPLFEPEFARKGGLCTCADAPENSQRKFILSGYRHLDTDSSALRCVLTSLTFFHNESVNIWTHLLR
jgi:hypothetical protein